MLQVFSETRHLRRDGQELLGYEKIAALSPIAVAHPDLSGVQYPVLIGSALFQQRRQRNGGLVDVEWQPSDALTLDGSSSPRSSRRPTSTTIISCGARHILGGGNGQAPLPRLRHNQQHPDEGHVRGSAGHRIRRLRSDLAS